jgi:competence protein ComEA
VSTDPTAGAARRWPGWLVPVLAGLGGLAAGFLGVAVALIAVVAVAGVPGAAEDEAFGEPLDFAAAAGGAATEPARPAGIVVDVAGAVVRPGLHRLEAGARVGDAIMAAGGFAPRADLMAASQALNLAQALEDGTKVLVPELGTLEVGAGSAFDDGTIDLNRAGQAELESLPGIGPVTAGRIIEARREQRFESVRDLRTRGLVGESVFADIEDLVSAS